MVLFLLPQIFTLFLLLILRWLSCLSFKWFYFQLNPLIICGCARSFILECFGKHNSTSSRTWIWARSLSLRHRHVVNKSDLTRGFEDGRNCFRMLIIFLNKTSKIFPASNGSSIFIVRVNYKRLRCEQFEQLHALSGCLYYSMDTVWWNICQFLCWNQISS